MFPAFRLSIIRTSSLKLEGLNKHKDSMLQMLHGANAKNESSGFFLFCFFARIGGFPSRYVCVLGREEYLLTCVPWCQKSALNYSYSRIRNAIISLFILLFYQSVPLPSWESSKLAVKTFFFLMNKSNLQKRITVLWNQFSRLVLQINQVRRRSHTYLIDYEISNMSPLNGTICTERGGVLSIKVATMTFSIL